MASESFGENFPSHSEVFVSLLFASEIGEAVSSVGSWYLIVALVLSFMGSLIANSDEQSTLRLHRHASAKKVFDQIESRRDSNGVSILDLNEVANELGFDNKVVKADSLESVSLPCLSHFEPKQKGLPVDGHFVVVVSSDGSRCKYLDGTTAILHDVRLDWFEDRATGYHLISTVQDDHQPYRLVNGVLLLLCVVGLAVLLKKTRVAAVFLLVAFTVGVGLNASEGPGYPLSEEQRRVVEYDEINMLYLLLKSHGIDASYSDVERSLSYHGKPKSLLELANSGAEFGAGLKCVDLADAIRSKALPVITDYRTDDGKHGYFVLLYQANDGQVDVIEGGIGGLDRLPASEFLRNNSGICVACTHKEANQLVLFGISLASAFVCTVLFKSYFSRH
jgi:ABC-type bacteriocin/lantibiotic exporter with double-glycine peptidase domain